MGSRCPKPYGDECGDVARPVSALPGFDDRCRAVCISAQGRYATVRVNRHKSPPAKPLTGADRPQPATWLDSVIPDERTFGRDGSNSQRLLPGSAAPWAVWASRDRQE